MKHGMALPGATKCSKNHQKLVFHQSAQETHYCLSQVVERSLLVKEGRSRQEEGHGNSSSWWLFGVFSGPKIWRLDNISMPTVSWPKWYQPLSFLLWLCWTKSYIYMNTEFCYSHSPEDGGSIYLWNIGSPAHIVMIQICDSEPLWKREVSRTVRSECNLLFGLMCTHCYILNTTVLGTGSVTESWLLEAAQTPCCAEHLQDGELYGSCLATCSHSWLSTPYIMFKLCITSPSPRNRIFLRNLWLLS